jgi:hypothetical protein
MPLRMYAPSRPAVARRLTAALALLAVGLAGCQPTPGVSKYTAPKDPPDTDLVSDEPAAGEPAVRVLGAIAPAGDKPDDWYFFKFQPPRMGDTYSPKAIERHAADFEAFLKSLKFSPDGPPVWTLPAGWKEVTVSTQIPRVATLRMKKSETTVDLAVSRASGKLLENVNRWRGQAGADPITEAEVETKCRVLTVDGRRVVVVDVSGPGGKGGMVPPFAK